MNQCLSHVPNRDITHTPSAIATELRPLPGPCGRRSHFLYRASAPTGALRKTFSFSLPSFGPCRGLDTPVSMRFYQALAPTGAIRGRPVPRRSLRPTICPDRDKSSVGPSPAPSTIAPVRGGTMPRLGATQCPGQGQKLGRRSSTARFPIAPVRGGTMPRLGATQCPGQGQKLGRRSSTARSPIAPTGAKPCPD